MLNPSEKAYCQALLALRNKQFDSASEHFEKAAPYFRDDREFKVLKETNDLLVAVKRELKTLERKDSIEIEEVFSDG